VRPDLAARLLALRQVLDDPAGLPSDSRVEVAGTWDQLVAEVRAIPGFEGFLRPATPEEILQDLPGPVVVINVGELRCDALIVQDGKVSVCPLPGLHDGRASQMASACLIALLRKDLPPEQQPDLPPTEVEKVVTDTNAWLWDAVAEPVLAFLGHHDAHRGALQVAPLTSLPFGRLAGRGTWTARQPGDVDPIFERYGVSTWA